jgi:hypothetical protein
VVRIAEGLGEVGYVWSADGGQANGGGDGDGVAAEADGCGQQVVEVGGDGVQVVAVGGGGAE